MGDVLIVTGASRGIGRATALQAGAAGYHVVVNYVANAAAAEAVVDAIVRAGGKATAVQGDVGQEADVLALFAAADALGPLAGLVNNAGIVDQSARLVDISAERITRIMNANVVGSLLCAREAVKRMSTQRGGKGGVIVNVSSRAGVSGYHAVAYGTSKWAVRGLSRTASMELGRLGIRVNTLLPGYIDTPMSSTAPDWFREASLEEIPLGRLGTVDDIAPLMVFLMSDESSYISGAEFHVDGGEYGHAGVKRYSDLARSGGLNKGQGS